MPTLSAKPDFLASRWFMWLLTLGIFCTAIGFALYTNHRWEDWYITYRASKNLALGHGLVFTIGERVHSFTSPIGTLVPALLAYLTNGQDEAVIWLYRIISAGVLALAGIQLLRLMQDLRWQTHAILLTLGLFSTNILIVDFTINGMETAFMMLFLLCYARQLFSLTKESSLRSIILFGLTVAALLYTRPDSFIYAGSLTAGVLLFNPQTTADFRSRKELIVLLVKACVIGALLYLPWFLWVWSYYGTPIPHTIIAKAGQRHMTWFMVQKIIFHPLTLLTNSSNLTALFLPANAGIFGWYLSGMVLSRILSISAFLAFFIFYKYGLIAALSLAAFLLSIYLEYISGQGAAAWYLPNIAIFVVLTLGAMMQIFSQKPTRLARKIAAGVIVVCTTFSVISLVLGAVELQTQQRVIEDGNRKQIGLWLKEHAHTPKDTVFVECLGYIGFYSNLKMHDYPGMATPEMVAVLKGVQTDHFAHASYRLQSDWLVLRPREVEAINQTFPGFLSQQYQLRKIFDVSDEVPATAPSKDYLLYDATFNVYERKQRNAQSE